jgi:hypothetical protein
MRDLIKKILNEQLYEESVIAEMAKAKGYCGKHFSSISPELPFCNAAENYIKTEIEQIGKRKSKVIFDKFRKGLASFYEKIEDDVLEIKIEELTNIHNVVIEGKKELQDAENMLRGNCTNINYVAKRQVNLLKDKAQLYFTGKNGEYSLTNRLDTNYSAIAILFTKFFSKKGAFDGVGYDSNNDWVKITKNWIEHSFNPSINFIDIRPEHEKNDKSAELSSLEFQELAKIYFSNSITFGSSEIRSMVDDVLTDVRKRGFESEKQFEKSYLDDGKKEFKRYAKDYGFVDRFLGIDFIYKGKNFWIPVQVKSSPQEATYLISSLGCKTYVIAEKTGKTFKINTLHSDKLSD